MSLKKNGSRNVGAKVYIRKGNSPDRQLRSLIMLSEVARKREYGY